MIYRYTTSCPYPLLLIMALSKKLVNHDCLELILDNKLMNHPFNYKQGFNHSQTPHHLSIQGHQIKIKKLVQLKDKINVL